MNIAPRFAGKFEIDTKSYYAGDDSFLSPFMKRVAPEATEAYEKEIRKAIEPYQPFIDALPDEVTIRYKVNSKGDFIHVDVKDPFGDGVSSGGTHGGSVFRDFLPNGGSFGKSDLEAAFKFNDDHRVMIKEFMGQVYWNSKTKLEAFHREKLNAIQNQMAQTLGKYDYLMHLMKQGDAQFWKAFREKPPTMADPNS